MIYVIHNVQNGGWIRTWKMVGHDKHIDVYYAGLDQAKRFLSLSAAQLFIETITFNNSDYCDKKDLEIVEFQETRIYSADGKLQAIKKN